jgi:pimeloyl-ACP methyl ester carboxylesterase
MTCLKLHEAKEHLHCMPILPIDGFVSANGLQLHYRRWSPANPSPHLPPILLLHGLASASRIWDLVAPLLTERGYVVTALDQRGHGESEKPNTGYDFATIVADDAAVVQTLSIIDPIIVGHSWGAAVALQYAATYPDRVSALVLVDGATNQLSLRPNWSREQAMQDLAPPRFAGTPREVFLSRIRSSPLEQLWTSQLEDIILHIVQLREDDTVAPRLDFDNHLQIIGAMWDQPTFDLYQQVTCPITLVVAEQETTDPSREAFFRMRHEGIARIQALRPDIRVVRMPNTIHDIPLQRPVQLVEEIDVS